MQYPTIEQVNDASREDICRWWRFLPSPVNMSQQVTMEEIAKRFRTYGGFTPALSKKIGWGQSN